MLSSGVIRGTREQIADRLREEVLCGRLSVGERLSEVKLAERFGVSRGSIREALSQLVCEGILVAKPNCGVAVASPAPESIHGLILPIRRMLEVYALKFIYPTLTEDDFRAWDSILLQMEHACRLRDLSSFPQLDLVLHRSILERAGQPDVVAIWHSIAYRLRAHFWQEVKEADERGDLMHLHKHHCELIAAFRSGDLNTAVKALEDHIAEN